MDNKNSKTLYKELRDLIEETSNSIKNTCHEINVDLPTKFRNDPDAMISIPRVTNYSEGKNVQFVVGIRTDGILVHFNDGLFTYDGSIDQVNPLAMIQILKALEEIHATNAAVAYAF